MKYLKGCLISIIGCVILIIILFFFYKNDVISNLKTKEETVETSWKKYVQIIKKRNSKLKEQNLENDSLKYFVDKSDKIEVREFSTEFEFIEYKIDRILNKEKNVIEYNNDLNENVSIYNQAVRDYNRYRGTFPNFFIAKKANCRKSFEYSDIVIYGIENQNPKIKRAKIAYWIENGGDFPK